SECAHAACAGSDDWPAGHLRLHGRHDSHCQAAPGPDFADSRFPRRDRQRFARGRARGRRRTIPPDSRLQGVDQGSATMTALFIRRPVMTALVMIGILFFGAVSYTRLAVSDLPTVDFPTIQVNANLPGASPETMAAAVAT